MALDMEMKDAFEAGLKPIKEVQTELKQAQTALAEQVKAMEEKAAQKDDLTDIRGRIEESHAKLTTLGETYTELQKKLANRQTETQDAASIIARHDGFKSAILSGRNLEFKDITTANISASDDNPVGGRRAGRGLLAPTTQRLFLRDVIPTAATNLAAMDYLQESGYTNNAAVVPEGGLKPQSELTFEQKVIVMKKMAHTFRVSEEMLDDNDGMEAYIRERGIYGLRLKEEQQLVNGNGSATQLDGLLSQSTAYVGSTVPGVTSTGLEDDIRIAIAQVEGADLAASAVLMNYLDAAAVQLERDADGNLRNPAFGNGTVWGLPVVATKGIPQGQFIVGGFLGNAIIWQRKGMEVRRSTEDRDNFIRNLITILIEERLNLEVLRPEGIVVGNITAPTP